MVLFGALLAPAILAGGLLAGEIRGFEEGRQGGGAVGGGAASVAFEPVIVPAPARPDRRYAGVVPAPARSMPQERGREQRREVVDEEVRPEVVEEPVTPVPVRTQDGCPGEWVDTWLWELCRDREQEGMAGESLVPGM
ncbi:hypothetical protein GCM10022224_041870 [Nonomuraea antimicrobica]|uniref:Uncharacterized protein n=1 Tax=Nonomuraea antimicrobica TaxID=561173 RepID=A0ABP7C0J3_9ACTN